MTRPPGHHGQMRPPGPHGPQLAWVRATIAFRQRHQKLHLSDTLTVAGALEYFADIEEARREWVRAVERAGYRGVFHPDHSPRVYHVSQHR